MIWLVRLIAFTFNARIGARVLLGGCTYMAAPIIRAIDGLKWNELLWKQGNMGSMTFICSSRMTIP